MPTLYHAPFSRSSSILALIEEMDGTDRIEIVPVRVTRPDGGDPDPRNPHPEGKVPYLVSGEDHVRERGAIVAYLCDLFPEAGLGRPVGHPQRGAFMSWLFYYQGVMEPVLALHAAGLVHPVLRATFRDVDAMCDRLAEGLDGRPYLLGDGYSAVVLLLSSPFAWLPDVLPQGSPVRDWAARCGDRLSIRDTAERDQATLAA
jgi:glutathione S-transferase